MARDKLTVILQDRPDLLHLVQTLLGRQPGVRVLHASHHDDGPEKSFRTQADGVAEDEPG